MAVSVVMYLMPSRGREGGTNERTNLPTHSLVIVIVYISLQMCLTTTPIITSQHGQ